MYLFSFLYLPGALVWFTALFTCKHSTSILPTQHQYCTTLIDASQMERTCVFDGFNYILMILRDICFASFILNMQQITFCFNLSLQNENIFHNEKNDNICHRYLSTNLSFIMQFMLSLLHENLYSTKVGFIISIPTTDTSGTTRITLESEIKINK